MQAGCSIIQARADSEKAKPEPRVRIASVARTVKKFIEHAVYQRNFTFR